MQKRYPFKYLDAYTRSDKDFYFGRDEEVKQLYEMTFQTDLLLVYGASGTGKTSLIQCGLANRFESHDWLALTIRRGNNINLSLERIINDAIGDNAGYFDDEWDSEEEVPVNDSPLAKQIKALRLKYFKPIYLIFDQFEELYILGNKEEQETFYQTVKQLLSLNQPIKIIITIREEYLGYLYYFEQLVPTILKKKLRVEPMTLDKVRLVLQGINNPTTSLVTLQKGDEEELIQGVFNKLREGKISIDLPYLQVLLDKLYLSLTNNDEQHETEATFNLNALEKLGDLGDILFGLLDGLVSQLEAQNNIKPEIAWNVLSCFVTIEGTKEPLPEKTIQEQLPAIEPATLTEILQFFVSKRILRYVENEQVFEIAHDTLAKQIHANRSVDEVARLQVKKLIQDTLHKDEKLREFFTAKQLKEIDLYIKDLDLTPEEAAWIKQSRQSVEKAEKKKRKELLFTRLALAIAIVFLIFAGWQYFAARKAEKETQQALIHANNLINAFYFYDDKFALVSHKTYNYDKGYNSGNVSYFIDKDGHEITKLGHWDKAEQFDNTDFAKVTKANIVFLLDTLGNAYRYTNDINRLDSTVQILDLSGQQLSELPIEITDFSNLKVLWLNDNRLNNLPAKIGNLTNLIELNLTGNQLNSLPAEIGNLTQLKKLDLSMNKQLMSLPAEIGKLINLTKLDLWGTQLSSLPAEIGNLTDLTDLRLWGNPLIKLPSEIGNLTHLTELELNGSQLTSLPSEIGNLTHLRKLDLSGNQLTSLPAEIGKLINLEKLELYGNRLTNLPPEIGCLTQLVVIDLRKNLVTNFPAEIKNLNHLGRLILSENQLTNFPTEICKIPNLFFLHLDNNRLTNLPPEIGNLTSLNELDLSNNQFTKLPSEIKKLTNLSTCEISYNELLDDMSKEIVYKLLQEDKSLFRTLSRNPMRYILKYKIELILLIGIFGSIIGIFCFSLKKYRFYEWLCWGIMIVNWILFMIRYLTYGRGL